MQTPKRDVMWVAGAKKDFDAFPRPVQRKMGVALLVAQYGGKAGSAKPLSGFAGSGVLEIVEGHSGDTYRAAYTVRLRHAVYVLHCFQKKSTRGIATPKREIELIRSRLHEAERADREEGKPDV